MSRHVIVTDNIYRNYRDIIEINPFDTENLKMLREYDKKNNTTYSKYALDCIKINDKEKYELEKLVFPVFKGIYVIMIVMELVMFVLLNMKWI